ncbi:MAG: zf-HC2 domain-containing protein [Planctomycetota bacterium]
MSCERIRHLLVLEADGEADLQEKRQIEMHLVRCPACRVERERTRHDWQEIVADCAALRDRTSGGRKPSRLAIEPLEFRVLSKSLPGNGCAPRAGVGAGPAPLNGAALQNLHKRRGPNGRTDQPHAERGQRKTSARPHQRVRLSLAAGIAIIAVVAAAVALLSNERPFGVVTGAHDLALIRGSTELRASAGMPLAAGDRLQANEGGSLRLNDQMALTLGPAARLVIKASDQVGLEAGVCRASGTGHLRIDLNGGRAELAAEGESPFDVEVSVASTLQPASASPDAQIRVLRGDLRIRIDGGASTPLPRGGYSVIEGGLRRDPLPDPDAPLPGDEEAPDGGEEPARGPDHRDSGGNDDGGGKHGGSKTNNLGGFHASLLGLIYDSFTGIPISGARLVLASMSDEPGDSRWDLPSGRLRWRHRWTTSDREGVAFLDQLPPDVYAVFVEVPNDGSYSREDFSWVILSPGTLVVLPLPIGSCLSELPCRLVDRHGEGAGGVLVRHEGSDDEVIQTEEDGSFVLESLRAGEHALRFESPGWRAGSLRMRLEYRSRKGPMTGGAETLAFSGGMPAIAIPGTPWHLQATPPAGWLLRAEEAPSEDDNGLASDLGGGLTGGPGGRDVATPR